MSDDEPDVEPIGAWAHFVDELWFEFKRTGWIVVLLIWLLCVTDVLFGMVR